MVRRSSNKARQSSGSVLEEFDPSIRNNSRKVTFDFLTTHLYAAADILRGSLDPSEYRQPVMTILFLKRLNDRFEEKAEELVVQGKSEKEAYHNPARHNFYVP